MRSHLHRVLVSTGLAAATLLGVPSSSFAQVRDHRHNQPAAEAGPRDAPPPPREERHEARREGFVWIGGRWDWSRREHRWDWIPGHWERERRGQRWREARWERRGDEWVLADGDWIQAEVRPTAPPPPPREERFEARPGFAWIRGRWDWRDGNWAWIDGHWERERAGRRWNEGRWELRGDHWEWIEGGWGEVPAYPPIDQPPPPPRREDIRQEPGRVVVPGHWRWENGRYAWTPWRYAEKTIPGKHYQPGQWKPHGTYWLWDDGDWVNDAPPPGRPPSNYPPPAAPPSNYPPPAAPPSGPSSAPPPPREERVEARAGFVWVRGRYDWRNNQYEWIPGHWERQRAKQVWYDGRWEQRGNVWVYIEGGWR